MCFLAGSVWFASEMKALHDDCERFEAFPPGHIYSSKQGIISFFVYCLLELIRNMNNEV